MCDRLRVAFNSRVFSRHPYFCYRFFQELHDLRFRCFTVESCYHSLTFILVSMCAPGFVTSVSPLFACICRQWLSSSRVVVLRMNPRKVVETLPSFRRFSSDLLSASIISLRTTHLHLVSSVCLRSLQPTFFWSLSSSDSSVSIGSLLSSSLNRSFCSNVVCSPFFIQHFSIVYEVCHASRDCRSSLDFIQY